MGLFDLFKKKSTEKSPQSAAKELVSNEPALQIVSLFYENSPEPHKNKILPELKLRFKNVEVSSDDRPLNFFFPGYVNNLNNESIPARGTIVTIDTKVYSDRFTKAFPQSWHWREVKPIINDCSYELELFDFISENLAHQTRLEIFQKFLSAVVKATNPAVIYFRNSEKFIKPEDFLEACDKEQGDFLHGAMNIRLFNIGDGEVLMDTFGLHAFGLADFECRFTRKYDPGEIAGVLTNIAYYVFETGDLIRSDTTIQGIGKNPIWKTQYKESMAEPKRLVVNVIPS
ncbi:DUF4261 domain-containing protein [Emticicia sp. BO119]|uniref:DUF4261 domain-containing protein n=1 Tax=Emticicia sp. BO119 TaxID=2757768 RepID=UPI0015F0B7F4|nr:DUF4261 domain-containing protein [Emticicia sp. BO119]MBA4851628.1 DUF4261 domain-containing protein [Emticicia sp. BO119]